MREASVIPAQAGIQRAKRKWTPAFAGVTWTASAVLALAALLVLCFSTLPAHDSEAAMPAGIGSALDTAPPWTPVAVWKDCQEIALCTGCRAVYKCRSCTYQRTCRRGRCQWSDVCVWGPAVKVLPRGARIIRR